ncbi:hypothetical protein HND96_11230 [Proteus terrae subsp. cibarius]|uniref:hypothetical protein n=1 Tax=Proteus terrae TaxID=1574161 RepID=UPI00131FD4A1|nr:hypothetical protein [Proteus terrae]QHD95996.1 hypothetical protein GSM99_17080 [Proteus terrae subsp. cibarius]QJW51421.1 hypothetical protein HND96_11230 [Proteus terrae subsp. cibarius]
MSLYLTILFTSIFCVLALSPICLTINNRISENKKNTNTQNEISKEKRPLFLLDERSLQSQPMFWTAIALPLIAGVFLLAMISPNYDLNFTLSAYKTFMEIAQLPSVILALSPIFGAFVVYAHRSYQTDIQIKTAKEQLEEAQKKNKVDIYFSKKKFINEQLKDIKDLNGNKIENTNLIITKFTRNTTNFDIEPNIEVFNNLNEKIKLLNKRISNLYSIYKNIVFPISKEIEFNYDKQVEIKNFIKKILTSLRIIKLTLSIEYNDPSLNRIFERYSFLDRNIFSEKEKIPTHQEICNQFSILISDINCMKLDIYQITKEITLTLLISDDVEKYIPELNKLIEN